MHPSRKAALEYIDILRSRGLLHRIYDHLSAEPNLQDSELHLLRIAERAREPIHVSGISDVDIIGFAFGMLLMETAGFLRKQRDELMREGSGLVLPSGKQLIS